MSGIDTSTSTPANAPPSADDIDVVHPQFDVLPPSVGDIGHFVSRHIPVIRQPPALRFERPMERQSDVFETLVSQHVKQLQLKDPDAVAYDLAEFVVRRMPEIEVSKLSPAAADGFESLVDTVRMFEHIYVIRSGTGGQT